MPTKLATDNLAARYLHKEVTVAPSIILNVAQKIGQTRRENFPCIV